MAAGDIDGDGDVDLVSAQYGKAFTYQEICNYVYVNDGKGNFQHDPSRIKAAPYYEHDTIALVDIDDDGDLDLLEGGNYRISGGPPNGIRTQINDGKGRFVVDPTVLPLPAGVRAVAGPAHFADFDGDGDRDVIGGYLWFNTKRQLLTDQPVIGKPATLSLYSETNHTMTPVFGLSYKLTDLGSLGTLYMDPATMAFGKTVFFRSTGVITQQINVPNDSRLIGLRILTQGLDVFGPGSNPQLRLTTAMWDTIK